jgi:hypothetical protein
MKITNVSPYGDLEVPLLRAVLYAGETVDVTEAQARALLPQVGNYEAADDEAKAVVAELQAADPDGVPKPSDLLETWRAYASAQGDTEADSKTKKQLIAEYGGTGDQS